MRKLFSCDLTATTDRWFAEHQQQCGGQFIKIKEPDKGKMPKKAKTTKTEADGTTPKPAEPSLDRWVKRGGTAPIVGPRVSPPPPPLERREVILVSSGETPPASPSSKKRKSEEKSSKKEEKKVTQAEDSDDDFRLIDRRGSLNRID